MHFTQLLPLTLLGATSVTAAAIHPTGHISPYNVSPTPVIRPPYPTPYSSEGFIAKDGATGRERRSEGEAARLKDDSSKASLPYGPMMGLVRRHRRRRRDVDFDGIDKNPVSHYYPTPVTPYYPVITPTPANHGAQDPAPSTEACVGCIQPLGDSKGLLAKRDPSDADMVMDKAFDILGGKEEEEEMS